MRTRSTATTSRAPCLARLTFSVRMLTCRDPPRRLVAGGSSTGARSASRSRSTRVRPAQTTAPAPTSNQSTTVRNSRLGCFFFLSLSRSSRAARSSARGGRRNGRRARWVDGDGGSGNPQTGASCDRVRASVKVVCDGAFVSNLNPEAAFLRGGRRCLGL